MVKKRIENNYVYNKKSKTKTNHKDKIINLKEYLEVQKDIYDSEVIQFFYYEILHAKTKESQF